MNIAMALVVSVALFGGACKKDPGDAPSGSRAAGSSAPAAGSGGAVAAAPPAVECRDAARVYAKLLAEGTGNALADMKPSDAVRSLARVMFEEDCDNSWSAETKACIAATTSSADLGKCWTDAAARAAAERQIAAVVDEIKTRAPK